MLISVTYFYTIFFLILIQKILSMDSEDEKRTLDREKRRKWRFLIKHDNEPFKSIRGVLNCLSFRQFKTKSHVTPSNAQRIGPQ